VFAGVVVSPITTVTISVTIEDDCDVNADELVVAAEAVVDSALANGVV